MSHHEEPKSSLTLRTMILGALGSAVLTCSSLYVALKMGALPWPIVFAALASVLALRALGSHDLHEANVTHAAMSAGSMVAGGLAFTIPGLWILNVGAQVSLVQVLVASLGGTVLGLVACAVLQPYFIRHQRLAFPIGLSAAETLKATADTQGAGGKVLFGSMGFSALFAFLRDSLGVLPTVLFSSNALPGVALGLYNSPMIIGTGFIVGAIPATVWFAGSVLGNLGIVGLLPALGLADVDVASAMRSSLGLGLMLGVGAGVTLKNLVPLAVNHFTGKGNSANADDENDPKSLHVSRSTVAVACAAVACIAAFTLQLSLVPSLLMVLAAWFCVYLSGWLTGTMGINPMEIFGVMVLLLLQLLFHDLSIESLFLASAVVAVACGMCGDVMNDLKAGDELGTNPVDQFGGMVIGGVVGAIVGACLLWTMGTVYGPEAFGANGTFVAAQANVVATMAGGIPHLPAFIAGIVIGCVLAVAGLPVMTLGLGVYLPFYLSAGAAIGALIRVIFDRKNGSDSLGQTAAAGLLGGESLVGVITAFVALFVMLAS